jgi:hypothetical protein
MPLGTCVKCQKLVSYSALYCLDCYRDKIHSASTRCCDCGASVQKRTMRCRTCYFAYLKGRRACAPEHH